MTQKSKAPKRHHTVPVGYLKNFTDSKGLNWVITHELRKFSNIPKNILNRKNYNTITFKDGSKSFVIESGFLNQIETDFCAVNDSKVSHMTQLDQQDKAIISVFIAAQILRVEGRRDAMLDFMNRIEEQTSWMNDLTDEQKRQLADESRSIFSNNEESVPVSELLKHRKDMSTFMASGLPSGVEGLAPIIYEMNWALAYDRKGRFITSDDPVVLVNPTLDAMNGGMGSWMHAGLAQNDVELSFPLTKNVSILAGWKLEKDLQYIPVSDEHIEQLNMRQMRHSKSVVLSSEQAADQRLEEVKLRNKYYGVRNVLSEPFKEVVKKELKKTTSRQPTIVLAANES